VNSSLDLIIYIVGFANNLGSKDDWRAQGAFNGYLFSAVSPLFFLIHETFENSKSEKINTKILLSEKKN